MKVWFKVVETFNWQGNKNSINYTDYRYVCHTKLYLNQLVKDLNAWQSVLETKLKNKTLLIF